jgi:hypothetical protein
MDANGMKPRTLCALDAQRMVAEDGRKLGRLFDLSCRWRPGDASSPVEDLMYGRMGLLERVGLVQEKPPSVPWSAVRRVEQEAIVVSADASPGR